MQHGWNDNKNVYSSGRKHIFNVQGTHCTLDNQVYLRTGFTGAVTEGHTLCQSWHTAHTGRVRREYTSDVSIEGRSVHFALSNTWFGSHLMVTIYYPGSI